MCEHEKLEYPATGEKLKCKECGEEFEKDQWVIVKDEKGVGKYQIK